MKTFNMKMTETELRKLANQSYKDALRVVDALIGEAPEQPVVTGEIVAGFGSFEGSASQHPLLNRIVCAFVANYDSANCWSKKIKAIKFLRQITNWGLKESKDFVESATDEFDKKLFP